MQRSKKRQRDDAPVEENTTTTTRAPVEFVRTSLTREEHHTVEVRIGQTQFPSFTYHLRYENGNIRANLDSETPLAETPDNDEEMGEDETSEERVERPEQQMELVSNLGVAETSAVDPDFQTGSGARFSRRGREMAIPVLGDEYHNLRPGGNPPYLGVEYKDNQALRSLGKQTAIVDMEGVSFDDGIPYYSYCVIPYEIWITRQYLPRKQMSFTIPVDFAFCDLCRFVPAVFSMNEIDSINKTINSVQVDFETLNSLVISTSGFYVLPGKSEKDVFETMWMKLSHVEISAEIENHRRMKELMQQEFNRQRNESTLAAMMESLNNAESEDSNESELQTTEGPIGVTAAARLLEREPVPARASEPTIHQDLPSIYLLQKIDDVCGICLENMELRTRVWQCHKCERCLHILCANRMPRRECPSCRERIRSVNDISSVVRLGNTPSRPGPLNATTERFQAMQRNELMASVVPTRTPGTTTGPNVVAPRNDFSQAAEAMDRTQNELNQALNSRRFQEEIAPRIRRAQQQVLGLQETAARVEESLMARYSTVQENTRAETEQTTDDRRQLITDVMELAADVIDQRRREDEDRLSRVSAEVHTDALESLDDYLRGIVVDLISPQRANMIGQELLAHSLI